MAVTELNLNAKKLLVLKIKSIIKCLFLRSYRYWYLLLCNNLRILYSTVGNTWRLSFSSIEKAMIKNHGNAKTCCESDGPKCCRLVLHINI